MTDFNLPFSAWAGPRDAKIVLVGEAFGEKEDIAKQPFAGSSGMELFQMLGEAMPNVAPELHASICGEFRYGLNWLKRRGEWLNAAGIAFTNTFNFRPPDNSLDALSVKKPDLPAGYTLPALSMGKYLTGDWVHSNLARLTIELQECSPNLVVLCGNTACWALLGQTNIGSIRGNTTWTQRGKRIKALPTYHPAGVMRSWSWRPIVVADLMKAVREAETKELVRPERLIMVEPRIEEVRQWVSETLAQPPACLGCDTETAGGTITMISFASSPSRGITIPLLDSKRPGWSFWPDAATEILVLDEIEKLLNSDIPKIFQNGLYDYQYLLPMGLKMKNLQDDSMLRHHSILPEMKKGLGFLASIYTMEPTWKTMRLGKSDTEKRDE